MAGRRSPFFYTAVLYFVVDVLAVAAFALVTAGVLDHVRNLVWLRVHLLTIGVVVQMILANLPGFVSRKRGARLPGPRTTWALWLLVNASFAVLLVAMPAGLAHLAVVGALGIFAAIVVLLATTVPGGTRLPAADRAGVRLALVGPVFFLVGIVMAISMLLGWPAPGGGAGVLEAHVHANVWGFLGLVVAGVLLDRVPSAAGRPLPRPGLVPATSGLLIVGASGLVAGPWLGLLPLTLLGIVLYVGGTVLLLVNLAGTILGSRGLVPSLAHLLLAYVWMIVPAAAAPTILAITGKLPTGAVESAAVAGLVLGWILQIVIGAFVARLDQGGSARWRGSWFAVAALNLGVAALWVAAFLPDPASTWITVAGYALAVAGWLPPAAALIRQVTSRWPAAVPAP